MKKRTKKLFLIQSDNGPVLPIERRPEEQKFFASFLQKRSASLFFHTVFAVLVLAPIFSVSIPGLGDTLNHLARMHILATIDRSPDLQRFYEVHWSPIPYLAMDAVVPLLMHVLPIYLAGKLFVAACVVLPVLGAAAVHHVVHRRASLVPCAAWLVSTNALLSLGFLNFLFSAGLALLLFAGWIAAAGWPRWWRAVVFAPLVLVLYFGHAFACGAYCLAVFGVEAAAALRARFRPWPGILADLAAALAQAIPALFCAATLDVASGYVGPLHTEFGGLGDRLTAFLSPLLFLHDDIQGAVVLGALAAAALFAPRLGLSRALWPAVLVTILAALAVPHVLASTWGTDLRLPLVASLLFVSAMSVRVGGFGRLAALTWLALLVAAKSADAWVVLHRANAEFRQTRDIVAILPRGARLLVVNPAGHGTGHERVPLSTQWHMPMAALIDRDAFLPTLFTGLTTVRVRPAFRLSSTPNGLPISPDQLREGEAGDPGVDIGDGFGARLYHLGWTRKFDYVLMQQATMPIGQLPAELTMVAHDQDLALYSIHASH